ncbi:ABC transporter ATP-binding protein [Eggerthella sp. NSJ-70]|uniref:ABC transporter ATP-binding protein n=1 Tax=Eggerthella hominis TaxID=2763043 RepID=A0ABR7BM66_9ACTN|nr:ABC transporter ATP-binding protein [Eggerthella hominis]MBC5582698.1 ABC transporter ATP-binding protein [Eggerthella hominis]
MHLMELENVRYSYGSAQPVLRDVSLALEPGKLYAILGPSGCGKTTLLSLMGGLDEPDGGTVRFGGEDIAGTGLAEHRKHHVAFVFQSFNLIDYLTPAENVALITRSSPYPLLEELGLTDEEARRNVLKLSGGQQQRVAIARALASEAPVILADEPTGNLDEDTAAEITGILRSCAHKMEKCVVVVTHSRELARKADCVLRLKKGVVSQEDVVPAGGSASRRNPSSRRSRP